MPINASIPLSAVSAQKPIDLVAPFVKGVQLKQLGQKQQMGEMQLKEATRQWTEKEKVRGISKSHLAAGTFGSEEHLAEIGQAVPGQYAVIQEQFQKQQEGAAKVRKAQLDNDKQEIELARSYLETSIDQESYDRNKTAARERWGDEAVAGLPAIYTPEALLDMKERLDEAWRQNETARKVKQQQALLPGEVEQARQVEEATRPGRVEVARVRGEAAGQRQAEATERAADSALRVQRLKELQPTGEERKEYRTIQVTRTGANELLEQIDTAGVVEILGTIIDDPDAFLTRLYAKKIEAAATPEQRQFLANLAYIAGEMRRSLIGMAQTSIEMRSLVDFLPSKGDPPGAIKAKLTAIVDGMNRREGALEKTLEAFGVRAPKGSVTIGEEKPDPLGIRN